MSGERQNPFEDPDNAPVFDIKPKPRIVTSARVPTAQLDQIARENGFPSRQPQPPLAPRSRRRYTTGRNQQLNVKASATTIERFYRLADAAHVPLGELLERALEAYEKSLGGGE